MSERYIDVFFIILSGVVGRAELMACSFFLLAVLVYTRYCKYRDKSDSPDTGQRASSFRRWSLLVLTSVLATCSMLSKEQGVTVLAICLVYDVFIFSKMTPLQLLKIYTVSTKQNNNTYLYSALFEITPKSFVTHI